MIKIIERLALGMLHQTEILGNNSGQEAFSAHITFPFEVSREIDSVLHVRYIATQSKVQL